MVTMKIQQIAEMLPADQISSNVEIAAVLPGILPAMGNWIVRMGAMNATADWQHSPRAATRPASLTVEVANAFLCPRSVTNTRTVLMARMSQPVNVK